MRCRPKPRPRCLSGTAIFAIERHPKSGLNRKTTKPRSSVGSSGGRLRGSSGTGRASRESRHPLRLETPCFVQSSEKISCDSSATCCKSTFNRESFCVFSMVGKMLASTSKASRRCLASAASALALSSASFSALARAIAAAAASALALAFAAAAASRASTTTRSAASRASKAANCWRPSNCRSMSGLLAIFSANAGSIGSPLDVLSSSLASISRSFLRSARMRFSVAVSGAAFSRDV
mmetsp:Transcript_13477/g.36315  ORF Transcript_13477/g.36315 Transcript_13477/m.36315 type:complete len:237 (-) Transcript_13477:191-901(-)